MFGLKSIVLDGDVIKVAVERYLKDRLTPDACDFTVTEVSQPHSYRDEFTVKFEPRKPDFEISDN